MRLAVLDLGSNTIHALVVDVRKGGELEVVERGKRMPRIGAAIFRTGEISDPVARTAMAALAELVPMIERNDPEVVLAVATSAVREARNDAAFVAKVRDRFGLDVRIISGDEEARLAYAGARAQLGADVGRATLFDLGGGSLEVVVGEGPRLLLSRSAPLGVLRAVTECPLSDPPAPRELRALERWTRRQIAAFVQPLRELVLGELVFCAGTARALRSVGRALGHLPSSGAGSDRLTRERLRLIIDELTPLRLAARRKLPGLDPSRADLIVHGAVVFDTVLAVTGADEARVCRSALREGLIFEYLRGPLAGERPARRAFLAAAPDGRARSAG